MLPTPKQSHSQSTWYRYYAGYSEQFAASAISHMTADFQGGVILDPWNGAGTTTLAAARHGIPAYGYDLNPALVIASKAKLLPVSRLDCIYPLLQEVICHARRSRINPNRPPDLLQSWFDRKTANYFRRLELAIAKLVEGTQNCLTSESVSNATSSWSAWFYLLLFKTVRAFLMGFRTTNPTWIKLAKTNSELVSLTVDQIDAELESQLFVMLSSADGLTLEVEEGLTIGGVQIAVGDSRKLPIQDDTIELILSSPPYCTRIDYFRATLPELSVLFRENKSRLLALRDGLIGSTYTQKDFDLSKGNLLSAPAKKILKDIQGHASKASSSYYYKYFFSYFSNLSESLEEISRVSARRAKSCFVVQDSYYKDLHIDLPAIFSDEMNNRGWRLCSRYDYSAKATFSTLNRYNKKYSGRKKPTEAVLIFEK